MKSWPSSQAVLDDLGDKVVTAFRLAVADTRTDLTTYRNAHPGWAAEHSKRGLANWIHDRLWAHLLVRLDGLANVSIVDREPLREIWVSNNYCVRAKRHHLDGAISTYPTDTALEFLAQPGQLTLDGLVEMHLVIGYEWDKETNEVGRAVISLRDSDYVVFVDELPDDGEKGTAQGVTPLPPTEPAPPVVTDLTTDDKRGEEKRSE